MPIKQLLAENRVFALYLLSLAWLFASTLWYAIEVRTPPIAGLLVVAVACASMAAYALICRFAGPMLSRLKAACAGASICRDRSAPVPRPRLLLAILVALYTVIVALHFLWLGSIPALETFQAVDDYAISAIRAAAYTGLPPWLRYLSDYAVKSFGPMLLLLTWYYRSPLFWWVLLVGSVYCLALFVRILPLLFLGPLIIYLITRRAYRFALMGACLAIAITMFSTLVSSGLIRDHLHNQIASAKPPAVEPPAVEPPAVEPPAVEPPVVEPPVVEPPVVEPPVVEPPVVEPPAEPSVTYSIAYAVLHRALFVPGQVMNQWLDFYRDPHQREAGCGYKLLAWVLGCEYVHIPTKLYAHHYPGIVRDNGFTGSLNSGFFMVDFANFGLAGALFGAALAGLLFAIIYQIYGAHPLAIPFNLPLIPVLIESSLTTAINSGSGWIVSTALFLIFFRLNSVSDS